MQKLRAAHQRGDLLLLDHLPGDEVLDVGMVDVDDDHLGGAPGGAARLDGAGGAVADLEEAHQARRLAAARERLALAAQVGEVRARARAVLEEPRLAHPEVHDPALVDEVVPDALDEAGVRLRVLVGRLGLLQRARLEIDVVVTLGRAVDAIGPMQPGVEPLRRVGRRDLERQHGEELVIEGAGIRFAVEVAGLPAPIGPGAGEAVKHLLGRTLALVRLIVGRIRCVRGARALFGLRVRRAPPQPLRHAVLGHRFAPGCNAGLAEVFLGKDIAGDLRPAGRDLDVLLREHHRAVGVADLARGRAVGHLLARRSVVRRIVALDAHGASKAAKNRRSCATATQHTRQHIGDLGDRTAIYGK